MISNIQKFVSLYDKQQGGYKLEDIRNHIVCLPHLNENINFSFMEDFIAELEQARIAELEQAHITELEAYLIATGLNDYVLTEEENAVLEYFEQGNQEWSNYYLEEIFNIKNTTNLVKSEIMNCKGRVPYVSATQDNNGVSSYIDHNSEILMSGNSLFIGGKTFTVFYQPEDYFSNDSHNLWLELKDEKYRNKLVYLFMSTSVKIGLKRKYEWGNSISRTKIKSDFFRLPPKNNKPDYEFMETFISAIQKLIIKDVVLYNDVKVKATKRVVNYPNIQNQ